MGQARDYEALIRELLAGVAGGWSYGKTKRWLTNKKNTPESDLARWLREHGKELVGDSKILFQLQMLVRLGRGELAEVAAEIVKANLDREMTKTFWGELVVAPEMLEGWKKPTEKWEEYFYRGNKLYELGRYKEAISSYERAIRFKPDFHDAWFNRGISLANLGRYEEGISNYEQAIGFKPDFHGTWYNQGVALGKLCKYEEAISSYERAIACKPDFHEAWNNRGNMLDNLGKYEKAIFSYEQAIAFKPDFHEAWNNRGIILCDHLNKYEKALNSFQQAIVIKPNDPSTLYNQGVSLGKLDRYEEAISSYERAISLKPDKEAWTNHGVALGKLDRYEEAISSYEWAISFKPDDHEAWNNRGAALQYLGRYEDAIASLDRAIEFKPNFHVAWNNRGSTLQHLGRYEDAIASYKQAIEFQTDFHTAWDNRAIAIGILQGYQAAINTYHQAFQHIKSETHPEGWGFLQNRIGRTHYQEGKNRLFNYQCDLQSYYDYAFISYHNALETLTSDRFPKLRIETLIDTANVHLAQRNTPAAHQCKTEALDILRDLLNAQPTFAGKKRLQIEFISLSQLDVDLFIASGDNINAIVAAELDKNNRLTWLLSALAEDTISPSYAEMQQLLATSNASTQTGIVYWHLSPDNLTTFILTPNDAQPLVWENDRGSQAQQLAKWIKEWDTQYRDYGSKKEVSTQPNHNDEAAEKAREQHPWRQNIPNNLTQLRQILEIDRICARLPADLTYLILIPHGDLHRFPLHTLFLNSANLPNLQGCTYLPSIQIGLNLQHRSIPTRSYTPLLSVEDPETHQSEMPFARIESAIVRALFQPHTHIDSASASLAAVENALRQSHTSFHFTGHAAYNSHSPEASALALTDEPLTAKRIIQLDLSSYNLVTLAACETAITGREKIDTEYIGLTSAFLQAGAANILSTLWQVDEIANAWFTIYFYQQLLAGKSPAIALTLTQRWMQQVTWQNLADWLTKISQLPHIDIGIVDRLNARITNTLKEGGTIGLNRPTKYSHAYYWAAFTLTGEG
jgi:tetratricopeptide (TPR) repeat protein/CHAT domain-containing protein